ncbi:unnamed protein product, partial [marine sediment metagenome]
GQMQSPPWGGGQQGGMQQGPGAGMFSGGQQSPMRGGSSPYGGGMPQGGMPNYQSGSYQNSSYPQLQQRIYQQQMLNQMPANQMRQYLFEQGAGGMGINYQNAQQGSPFQGYGSQWGPTSQGAWTNSQPEMQGLQQQQYQPQGSSQHGPRNFGSYGKRYR